MVRACSLLKMVTLCTALAGRAGAQASVVGFVSARETAAPLAYADIIIGSHAPMFTNDRGEFRATQLPPGVIDIRIRRVGYAPVTITRTLVAGRTDTLRITLEPIALRLEQVRVSNAPCGGARASDTAVVTILQQVQLNAERAALLAREYPFTLVVERQLADELRDGPALARVRRRKVTQTDTLSIGSDPAWRYSPGTIINVRADTSAETSSTMRVPQLQDFADSAFIAAHCFRFAGLQSIDSVTRLRVDFEPTREVRTPDVRGSLYLDTATYDIRHTVLTIERISARAARDLWDHRIDTWFRDLSAGLPVIDRITQRTVARDAATHEIRSGQAATETQRVIEFRFGGRRPGEPQ